MWNGSACDMNVDKFFLGLIYVFIHRRCNISAFFHAHANATFVITNHNTGPEAHALTAGHDACHAGNINHLLIEFTVDFFASATTSPSATTTTISAPPVTTTPPTTATVSATAADAATTKSTTTGRLCFGRGNGLSGGFCIILLCGLCFCHNIYYSLKYQTTGARTIGKGFDASVVLVTGAVKYHSGDFFRFCLLGHQLSQSFRLRYLTFDLHFTGVGTDQCFSFRIINNLSAKILQTAGNMKTRLYRCAKNPDTGACLSSHLGKLCFAFLICHRCNYSAVLACFPAFLIMCSSMYLIPLPLYGSGLRKLRIRAAVSPTICLSAPSIVIIFFSTLAVTPSGTSKSIGCEKPKLNSSTLPFRTALYPTPLICNFFSKPLVTPVIMLLTKAPNNPHKERSLFSSGCLTVSLISFPAISTVTAGCTSCESSAFGPFTFSILPSSPASTPSGRVIRCRPILDIYLVYFANYFAAEAFFLGFSVGHEPL